MSLETSCGHLRPFVTDPRSMDGFFNSSSLESLKSSAILWDFCLHERFYFRKGLNVKRWSDRKNERILQIKLFYWEFLALSRHKENNDINSLMDEHNNWKPGLGC